MAEESPYRCAIEIQREIGNSTLTQIVSLESGAIRVEFDTTAGWHELHRLLKVSFPVDVTATEAVNEMQFGYVKRPTHRSRAYDKDLASRSATTATPPSATRATAPRCSTTASTA